jgi:putative ABC transport system permease protein
MNWFREIARRLWALVYRNQFDSDLQEEMRLHRELREQEEIERGLSPKEAHYAAQRRFGNELLLREKSRDVWGWICLEQVMRDIRFGFRQLRKSPGFTAVSVVTLTFGIGVNTTIFSLVNTVVLHPLPYPHAERLVRIDSRRPAYLLPYVEEGIRKQSRTFDSFGGCSFNPCNVMLNGAGKAMRLRVVDVSPEAFAVLGVPPLLGRTFLPDEEMPDAGQVVVLSYAAWRKYFNSDRGMIGKTINLSGKSHTVVGVMPPGFSFPSRLVDVWLPPSSTASFASSGSVGIEIAVGRLRPGVSTREAQAELNVIAEHLGWQSVTGEKLDLRVASLQEQTVGPVKKALWILLGAVGIVLFLACSNIANLLIAKNARRQREIAVCAALGASRPRLMRQLLTESLLLAFLGGCLGLVAALGGIRLVRVLAPPRLLLLEDVSINGWVLAFTLVASLLTGIAFGVLPAFAASKPNLIESLKEGSTASRAALGPALLPKTQGALTACQVALATILLIGAVLVVRSLSRLMSVRLGFDPQRLLVVELNGHDTLRLGRDAWMLFYQRVLDEVNALPGVESAALVSMPPLSRGGLVTFVSREGESMPVHSSDKALEREFELLMAGDSRARLTIIQFVSPNYFAAMKIPVLRGRAFTETDRYGSPPVAIVNETMARHLWPNGDAIGRKIYAQWRDSTWCDIVGVVGDSRDERWDKEPGLEVYRPNLQARDLQGALVVRTVVPPQHLSGAIISRISSANADQGVESAMTMDEVLSQSVIGPRFHATLFSFFAFLALLMASVGVYGVVSYSVSQRTHEIGIRMALGAKPADILRLAIGRQMIMTLLGVAIGLGVALGLTRLISSLLYGVAPNDLRTFIGVPILLGLTALLASYIPARRALDVNPVNALRQE